MSAIWALAHPDGQPASAENLARMGAALDTLEPGAAGQWREGPAGLGHRLMAFTPEDLFEQQPLDDGRAVLVFDGRLDNRLELAAALGLAAAETRDWPDSRFVQRAYQAWGEDCPRRLIGGLAFIVWDRQRARLFGASTPGNSCALFYTHTPQRLALASLPRGLLALPDVPRRLNEARLAAFLLHAPSGPRSATFFDGIHRLPGGHTLSFEAGVLTVRRYWTLDPRREIRFARDDDYMSAFNELFERVVADHLRSLTPVAVMMSGGLDSTTVAVTAARQLGRRGQRLVTFTSVPDARANDPVLPGRFGDESALVRAVAAMHENLEPAFIATDGLCFLDGLDERFEYTAAPPPAGPNQTWLDAILRAAADGGRRVILTGEAGNFSVSWPGHGLISHYLRHGRAGAAWHEAGALAARGRAPSRLHALAAHGLVPLLPDPLWEMLERLRGRAAQVSPSAIRPGFTTASVVTAERAAWARARRGRVPVDGRLARSSYAAHVTAHHVPAWRAQFGVDARDPTGDQRLVEFCLALPPEQFQRDGQARWLIRRAMAGRLPPEVLWNPQRGLQSSDWLYRLRARREAAAQSLRQIHADDLAARALDLPRLDRLVASWPEPQAGDTRTVDEYRLLQEALIAGRFIVWAQSGASSL
ncbi:MAG: asparagine synthase-related protein [Anaerolineales bacterium]